MDAVIREMAAVQKESYEQLTHYRRIHRRALVEATVDQLRKLIPSHGLFSTLQQRDRTGSCLPMPELLNTSHMQPPDSTTTITSSTLQIHPTPTPALVPTPPTTMSKDEVKKNLTALCPSPQLPSIRVGCSTSPGPYEQNHHAGEAPAELPAVRGVTPSTQPSHSGQPSIATSQSARISREQVIEKMRKLYGN